MNNIRQYIWEGRTVRLIDIPNPSYDQGQRRYWDNKLEYNKLSKTPQGAFIAWMIESAGDLWRTLTGYERLHSGNVGYMYEKVNRIINYEKANDWRMEIDPIEKTYLSNIYSDIKRLRSKTEELSWTKDALLSLVIRDPRKASTRMKWMKKRLDEYGLY
jgi:hypothetical protein